MSRPPLLLAVLAAALAAVPATAGAAALTAPLDRCYVSVGPEPTQRQLVRVQASGFTPLALVDVLMDGVPVDGNDDGVADAVYADERGSIDVSVRAPYQPSGERPVAITVTEHAQPAVTLSAFTRVTALSVALKPAQSPPSRPVRFRGRGFTARAPIYGHYVLHDRVRRTVRLAARPRGSCGRFSVRRRQIPVVRPRTGRWTLQVDQQRSWSPQPDSVFVRLDIRVRRVIGTSQR